MGERLATDAFAFGDVSLRITRRDISGASASDADGDPSGVTSDDEWTDPHFFDEDYSVAATTGFCRAWEGAEVLTRLMASDETLRGRLRGKRVVELGAGVQLCGLAAAAAARTSCSPTSPPSSPTSSDGTSPRIAPWTLPLLLPNPDRRRRPTRLPLPSSSSPASSPWPGAIPIVGDAGGTAVAQALDWTRPVDAQLDEQRASSSSAAARAAAESNPSDVAFWTARAAPVSDPRRADLLIAAECLWLRELLEPFVDTALSLMTRPSGASACILSFRDRSTTSIETPSAKTRDGVRTDDRDDAGGNGFERDDERRGRGRDGAGDRGRGKVRSRRNRNRNRNRNRTRGRVRSCARRGCGRSRLAGAVGKRSPRFRAERTRVSTSTSSRFGPRTTETRVRERRDTELPGFKPHTIHPREAARAGA